MGNAILFLSMLFAMVVRAEIGYYELVDSADYYINKEDFMETDEKASKSKKPFYRRWWFWLIIVVIGIIAAANSGNSTKEDTANANSVSRQEQNNSESVAKKTNVTTGQKNALKSAKNYLSLMGFSKSGLIKQLEFDGYSSEDATYAAENCNANWNEQAAKSAKNYLDTMPFSKSELIHQLEFDGYSKEEAEYGAQSAGY